MATSDRRAAENRGRRAELLAPRLLRPKGYRVLARRYKTPVGEIDLIVRRGRYIAFVEVKRRDSRDEATLAIPPTGRRRIARAAAAWLTAHPAAGNLHLRFDVILAAPHRWPKHLPGVFDADRS